MRRIIESTLLSLDGVIGSPHLWASERFDEEARAAALEQLEASDAMLMGRRTYEIFSRLWPSQTGSYADAINAIRKHVFAIHPIFVGEGTALLRQGATAVFELTGTRTLGTGVIALRYRPAGG